MRAGPVGAQILAGIAPKGRPRETERWTSALRSPLEFTPAPAMARGFLFAPQLLADRRDLECCQTRKAGWAGRARRTLRSCCSICSSRTSRSGRAAAGPAKVDGHRVGMLSLHGENIEDAGVDLFVCPRRMGDDKSARTVRRNEGGEPRSGEGRWRRKKRCDGRDCGRPLEGRSG